MLPAMVLLHSCWYSNKPPIDGVSGAVHSLWPSKIKKIAAPNDFDPEASYHWFSNHEKPTSPFLTAVNQVETRLHPSQSCFLSHKNDSKDLETELLWGFFVRGIPNINGGVDSIWKASRHQNGYTASLKHETPGASDHPTSPNKTKSRIASPETSPS